MTTQTDPLAKSVRGANPQTVMEKITRDKVYAMTFWKEKCFAVSAETLVDLAVADLTQVGGIYGGNNRATEFLCLTLKICLLYTSPSPRDKRQSRMPSSA